MNAAGAILATSCAAAAFVATFADVSAQSSCESLLSFKASNTTITSAELVPAGAFSSPPSGRSNAAQGFANPVAVCRVAATLKPSADSDIKVEVWMPSSGWNGKFQAVGNGGWAGLIDYPAMSAAVGRGYAASATDTGHTGDGGAFALGHPERFVDFAWRSEHEMTVSAKAIITAFYGSAPRFAYWNGCSTGGRQGLMEAQRFPGDYDGIIAGASANPRTQLNAAHLAVHQKVWRDPAGYIPAAKFPAIHAAVLDACDAIDGVTDRLIQDPTRCRFDPRVLACKGEDGPSCLTGPQIDAVTAIMSSVKTRDGVEIFPGREPGAELGWGVLFGQPEPGPLAVDTFKYLLYKNPNWDWRTFDLDRDVAKAVASPEVAIADAVDPDLSGFTKDGGKLLMYHGWSDPLVAPRASIKYYDSVLAAMGGTDKTSSWIRLFMVPGMGHCRPGDGPNTFDAIASLERWVEQGQAPTQIVASQITKGKVDRTRPLCPYPEAAVYKGTGSIDEAANFACKDPRAKTPP